jgi:hypothetical protein
LIRIDVILAVTPTVDVKVTCFEEPCVSPLKAFTVSVPELVTE